MMSTKAIEYGLPEGMELYNLGSYVEIVLKKYPVVARVFLTVFTAGWDGVLFQLFSWANFTPIPIFNPVLNAAIILSSFIFILSGVGLTYVAIACWFNQTYIRVGQGKVTVQVKPFPCFSNKSLNASDIKQIYAKEKVAYQEHGRSVTYEVHAINHSGKDTNLLRGLKSSEQAFFIEEEIEKYLNIQDAQIKDDEPARNHRRLIGSV